MANNGKNEGNGNFIQPSIPRFDGHYDHWSMLMENFLRSKEFWSLIETGYVEPKAGAAVTEAQRKRLEELKLKDLKVKNYLFQAIDRTILETILEKNTSKQIWDSMKRKYEGNARVKRSILQALRKEFETLEMKTVCSIEESKDIGVLSIDELQSSLIVHEQKFQKSNGEEQALKYECPTLNKEANYAELDEEEEILLMSHVELHEARREDAWFLDFGCSNHMCGDKTMFCELNEGFRQLVKLGNNTRMTVLGKGNVKLYLDGFHHVVTDVFYVPELKNNLLSVGQLQKKGLTILIKTGMCKIYHPVRGLIIQTRMTANKMFVLMARAQVKEASCFHAPAQDLSHLWHCRCGHLSHKGLRTLQYKKMVRGLPQLPTPTIMCNACVVGKQHRDPIPKKSQWRASQRLQLIHADICGPITPISNSKKRYSLCFIDDYSRKAWVYFLIEKSEAFQSFKYFTGQFIKCLRTDRGGEFNYVEFNEFCVSEESKGYRLYDPVAKRVVLLMDLEWGEEDSGIDEDEANGSEGNETSENDTEGSGNASSNTTSEDNVNPNERREIHAPVWMRDYVSGEGLSEEENELNIALVASADPLSYEEAAFHRGKCVGTVVCKMGQHRTTYKGYIAMLVVINSYRGRGIGNFS
ncbi:hypothetical protein EZV62_009250 [Acer yangbiense]|uniref:Uncharacterized protein n=1 Tax=Acer yangbiense TaxID=1000413 RepID=A0A5C7IG21_9ROSI|nr:hypothetical protein EZV62_009250 [Acer yangbiense]